MTHIEREQCLVASILDNPTAKWGEKVATAMAFVNWWESSEARIIALVIMGLVESGKVPSRAMVKASAGEVNKAWLDHPIFNVTNSLPWSCSESLVEPLLVHYRNRQITATIGNAYSRLVDCPQAALVVAKELREQLEAWV